jgi:hypothetical protein
MELDGLTDGVRSAAFSRWFNGESVRTPNYRYTQWRNEQDETTAHMLFDLVSDPHETSNVAEQPSYREVVKQLATLLSANDTSGNWSPKMRLLVERWTGD